MTKVKTFEDLEIWQKAIDIAVDMYEICDLGKLKTDFGFKDQIQRAAMSISSRGLQV
jgi:four helix bundle protein